VAIVVLFMTIPFAPAQTNETTIDFNAVLDTAQQWAQDNLDDDVLRALASVDREKVGDFLQHYQAELAGDSVLDLASMKATATTVLPLLDAHEITQPYAAWLRSRLDYFEAAEQLKKLAPPAPSPAPGQPILPAPNPTFKAEQAIWTTTLAARPLPKGAAKYLPTLKKIFAAERVPVELVWLAEVESGFDARAQSPAGAVGLFQLMPATAKSFGLSLWPFDQRKQVEPAAQAAAKYLHRLHQIFGDWRLMLAAYNCGEGTVQRALQRYKTKNYATIAPHLPAETQMYVPKVEATILKREGQALEKLKLASVSQKDAKISEFLATNFNVTTK
jgi:membrane-bound lytic murein transglycosylase D